MARIASPKIFLHLPVCPDRDNLRAGLMAMKLVPENLPAPSLARFALLQNLTPDQPVFLFIDISSLPPKVPSQFDQLANQMPAALKARTILTRLIAGHVSKVDRQWVKSLGFADLLAELDVSANQGGLRAALDAVAQTLQLPSVSSADLANYVRAVSATVDLSSPRAIIRKHTGMSAEQLVVLLNDHLDIKDRSYHLKKYPQCFVGAEAVAGMLRQLKLTKESALAVGRALGSLGLLHHVEHQHMFEDQPLFFRLALSRLPDPIHLGHALSTLHDQVVIADRTYLGTVYRNCWVGSEAVDIIARQFGIARHEAHLVLHRLMQFGLFEHVVNEQPFIDGNFFYRLGDRLSSAVN